MPKTTLRLRAPRPDRAARSTGTRERPCRVLVADDEPDARALVRAVVESLGFEVAEAHDGGELHQLLAMCPPGHFGVVIADDQMPVMRGAEVLARVGSRSRFVMLTGAGAPDAEDAADRCGAAAFVRKPIDVASFARMVRYVAHGRTAAAEAARRQAAAQATTQPSMDEQE